ALVEKYAKDNGYSMIIDVSQQNQPVWWASDSINITNEVISLYDKANPGAATSSATKPTAPSATTPAPAARPAAPATPPAATKKQ
ncbi:MAG: OmpH family outer membrane protein, partial [Acidobacteriia bacterium]|nr:OmpH family outer membrane protein [Terriglobia bacterium]